MPPTTRLSPPKATNHPLRRRLTALLCATCLSAVAAPMVHAQSALLESVKQNPALAQSLCQQFRQLQGGVQGPDHGVQKTVEQCRPIT